MIGAITEPISLGPLAIPRGALALFISLILVSLLFRLRLRRQKILRTVVEDALGRGALVALLIWKLGPLFSMPGRVFDSPITLLIVPGGPWVTAAALLLGLGVAAAGLYRKSHGRAVLFGAAGAYLLVLVAGAGLATSFLSAGGAQYERLPDLEVELLSGETRRLREFDSPVVLNVWATWCTPCKAELPVKLEAVERYGEQFTLLGVNLTSSETGIPAVRGYVEQHGLTYPVVLDRDGELASLIGVRGTPTTVIIDREGEIVRRRFGSMTLGWLEAGINEARR
ncbi:MAG: TlpA family protein disulfide reductase [Spirochaetaceae bacterium]